MLPPVANKLRVHLLGNQSVALQRRIIRAWLKEQKVAGISFDLVERVRALLDPQHGPAKVNLPDEKHARRRAGELFIE